MTSQGSRALVFLLLIMPATLWGSDWSVYGKRFDVTLKAKLPGRDNASSSFSFEVRDRKLRQTNSFTVDTRMTEIVAGWIIENSLVIIGRIGNAADLVISVRLPDAVVQKSFVCYGPATSPSGRWVLYRKFYPRFSDPPLTSDVVLLADVTNLSPGDQPGKILFPPENRKAKSLSVWVEEEKKRHNIFTGAGVVWLNSENSVLFIDSYDGRYHLVKVDALNSQPKSTTYSIDVSPKEAVPMRLTADNRVAEISFEGRPSIEIVLAAAPK